MIASVLFMLLVGVPTAETVTYREVAGQEMKMDVYSPPELKPGSPCVVVIHGGAWVGGKREDMAAISQAIAREGMVAATVSYRLGPTHKWPAMIEDVQAAVRFLRENSEKFKIDPKRIGAAGASAGGHLSLLLGTIDGWPNGNSTGKTSSKVAAVFNIFGPFDLSQDFNPGISSLLSLQVIGKKIEEAKDDIKMFSPSSHVTKDDAPVFTLQGKADPLVPFKQAERLDEALKSVGVSHTLRLVEGMGHGIDQTKPEQVKGVADGIAWLKAQLTG